MRRKRRASARVSTEGDTKKDLGSRLTKIPIPSSTHRVHLLQLPQHPERLKVERLPLLSRRFSFWLEQTYEKALVVDERVEAPWISRDRGRDEHVVGQPEGS